METTPLLTTSQRRQVVEHFATECVKEWPSDELPKATLYQDIHSEEYRLKAMKGIERVIPESEWNDLIYWLLRAQAFDRDPEGCLNQWGYAVSEKEAVKSNLDDDISFHIEAAARYR